MNLCNYKEYAIGGGWGKETKEIGLEAVSIIRGTDFSKIENGDFSTIPKRFETSKKIASRKVEVGDLIIEISGGSAASGQRTGRCLYITQEIIDKLGNPIIPASFCRLLRLKNINQKFIYYQIKLMHINDEIGLYENQSTGISNFQFNLFLDNVYPLVEKREIQDKVVSFLEKIDDKILLNTQTNQTLEAIAQAIFKSWFVDFDPVRAKAQAILDGKTSDEANLSAIAVISGKAIEDLTQTEYQQLWEIADAFPSELVENSEFGEVPKGWEVKPLPEMIDFLEGPGIRNWQYTESEDGIKFINIRCIKNNDLSLDTANKITKEEAFGKYAHFQLKEDDIVISTSGTLGRFAFVRKNHLPLCLNTSVIRFRPIENVSTLAFITGFVETQLQYELEIRASGSAQKNFGPMHLKQISMLAPNFNILSLHQKFIHFLFEKRKSNLDEIDNLVKARDLLLPKLLSGEI